MLVRLQAGYQCFGSLRPSLRWLVVLDSSCFKHHIDCPNYTASAYGDDPLAGLSEKRRGMLLESFARGLLERRYPDKPSENAHSLLMCTDGRSRGTYAAEWDFTLGGRRVELKTAMLSFNSRQQLWMVTWGNVKVAHQKQPFHDLYLLMYTPDGFHLIKHDLYTGLASAGARTTTQGYVIRVLGRVGQTSWKEAVKTILDKFTLTGSVELVARVARTDPAVSALYLEVLKSALHARDRAYEGVPMSNLRTTDRANRIQQIALEFDKMQNPGSSFACASGELSANGRRRRGRGNAAVDWIRNGVRVELKYAKVRFEPSGKSWACQFCNIKEEPPDASSKVYFDELWLAMYSPFSLDIFHHPGYRSQLSCRGLRTAVDGKNLVVRGEKHDPCVENAVRRIKAKLEAAHAEQLLTLRWSTDRAKLSRQS